MSATFRPIETIQRFAPLGIEFWDLLTDAPITDGLVVDARAASDTGRFHRANRSPRGIHALLDMPALRDLEDRRPAVGTFDETPTAPTTDLDLVVTDTQQRFLPAALRVTAPRDGLVSAAHALSGCASLALSIPSDAPPFLATAPTRSIASSRASIRTQLVDRTTRTPAAHAVLTATVAGLQYVGVADDQGQVLLPFPYPPFIDPLGPDSVPAGSHGLPTSEQTWTVTIRVRSLAAADLTFPAGIGTPLYHSLFCQPPAEIWAADGATDAIAELDVELRHGRQIVLRTADIDESVLFIDFATATP